MRRVRVLIAATAALPPLAASGLQAQGGRIPDLRHSSYLGVGYAASIPNAFIGGTALVLSHGLLGGAGLYADVKFSTGSPGNDPYFDPTITVDQASNQFGDFLLQQKSSWVSADLALVYAVTPELALYGGAGYSKERHYREYFDNSQTRGLAGFYWIADPAASGNRINALVGGLLRAGRYVMFQMGVEAQPQGAVVGVMLALPR